MIEDLQPYHYSTYLQRVQDAGIHGLRGLELFQAHQLKRICQSQQVEILKLSISVADANPDALYPDEFADNHIEFWRQSFGDSKDLELLIRTIDKFIENSSTICRFENTYNALLACYEALQNSGVAALEEEANQYERPYIRKLIDLCKEIVDESEGELAE
jgi:hypothetical protein